MSKTNYSKHADSVKRCLDAIHTARKQLLLESDKGRGYKKIVEAELQKVIESEAQKLGLNPQIIRKIYDAKI